MKACSFAKARMLLDISKSRVSEAAKAFI